MTAWEVWEFAWPWVVVLVMLIAAATILAIVAWFAWLAVRTMFGADDRSARGD